MVAGEIFGIESRVMLVSIFIESKDKIYTRY